MKNTPRLLMAAAILALPMMMNAQTARSITFAVDEGLRPVEDREETKQRYLERFGMAAKHGGVEYFCMEDTLSDNYMNQHEELKASRRRISGIVLDENGRPLDCATIHIMQFQPEKKIWGVKTTDSKGKFAFWIPREGIKLHFETFFHKTVKVEPTDKPLTIRMRLSKDGKKLKKLYFE